MRRRAFFAKFIFVPAIAMLFSLATVSQSVAQDRDHHRWRDHHHRDWRETEGLVRIHNRWKPDQFLNIESGRLTSGAIRGGWYSARWAVEDGPDGYVRLRNFWKPNEYIHIQHGYVEAGPIEARWWSAMWTIEPVPGTDFVRLRNRWKPNECLNVEHGELEAGPVGPGWWSAMWTLEPIDD